ncbi:helicase HerA-like domain-containing protein [Zhihengliuella sp.]|uniref:helicase HerA-like domain-containing protein n=1 Tax=Zhihengliuella sp. TaxID=1954483 RepID=UPI00281246ED|nr:helicase HerA-like domain-containing protein [Zhihengliuella sp.]
MAEKSAAERAENIRTGYTFDGGSVRLGTAMVDGEVFPEAAVALPLRMMNRHGLIAGATGTGKTITLQLMAEQLSEAGVPTFLADIKGDLTGLSTPGEASEKLAARTRNVGMDWSPATYPVEYFSLGGAGTGVPIRATVTSFGPLLLSRVLGLNETQEASLMLVFHYADQKNLELDDLKDLRAVIQYLTSDEGKDELADLGGLSKATAGVILRSLVTLETQGGDQFFGTPEFDTAELLRTVEDGRGVISCLELPTLLRQPLLFSTFLIWLLADLFEELPEVGDAEKPELVFFLDEAHLLFEDASKAFMDSITTTVRLIRSKGVGVFFITQTPQDVPAEVLGQLANRVQHALRAFTPDDAKALKATASTFPLSDYDLEEALTAAGTGEAIVTVMNETGSPTPVAWTRLWSPRSRMGASEEAVVEQAVAASGLLEEYGTVVDRASASEKLDGREQDQAGRAEQQPNHGRDRQTDSAESGTGRGSGERTTRPAGRAARNGSGRRPSTSTRRQDNPIMDVAVQVAGVLGKELVRGLFGTRRRRR